MMMPVRCCWRWRMGECRLVGGSKMGSTGTREELFGKRKEHGAPQKMQNPSLIELVRKKPLVCVVCLVCLVD